MSECITHHMCDCTAEKLRRLEEQLKKAREEELKELERAITGGDALDQFGPKVELEERWQRWQIKKEFVAHLNAITKASFDKIKGSDSFISLLTEDALTAPEVLLQIGIAVLHDKPIGLVIWKGVKVSETLEKIAYAIEYVENDSEETLSEACKRLLEKAPK